MLLVFNDLWISFYILFIYDHYNKQNAQNQQISGKHTHTKYPWMAINSKFMVGSYTR